LSAPRIADVHVPGLVGGHAVSAGCRWDLAHEGERSTGPDRQDRERSALAAREIQVPQHRAVRDDVDAVARAEAREHLPRLRVEPDADPLGAADEEEAAVLIQGEAPGSLAAVRPLRRDRAVTERDRDGRSLPEVRVGARPRDVDDEPLRPAGDLDVAVVNR